MENTYDQILKWLESSIDGMTENDLVQKIEVTNLIENLEKKLNEADKKEAEENEGLPF